MMNPAIITPTQASRLTPKRMYITAESRTDEDKTASKSASEPEATKDPDFTRSPVFLTKVPSASFAATATPTTARETAVYSAFSG